MQTLKIKYTTTEENRALIREYQHQYSSVLRFAYNRIKEGGTQTTAEHSAKSLNNVGLMESFFIRSAIKEAIQINSTKADKVVFGGRKNCIDRAKGLISSEQYRKKRISPLFSVGEANQKGNRKFQILGDCGGFLFKPCKSTHIELQIAGGYKRYKELLKKLYAFQENKEIPISYKLDTEYIYVSFDEEILKRKQMPQIKDRVMAIDLNPNYVGWSVVDWKSSSEFTVIEKGVFSIKEINDKDYALKKTRNNPNGYSSDHPKRVYLNNKRNHEVLEITKNMVNKAVHYKCSLFAVEGLEISHKKKTDETASTPYKKSSKYRKLVNNMWNRDKLVNNLKKRCKIYNISYLEVKSDYSSFIGNFLFRDLGLPDMVLASIEIGRRGYEFNAQYVIKEKEIKRNIIRPEIGDFADRYAKSLEEFGVEGEFQDMVELYYRLKNLKCRYRVSLESLSPRFFRCFSKASRVCVAEV